MSVTVIICNGDFPKSEYPRYLIRTADHIVCCDGALKAWLRNMDKLFGKERLPDRIIGDMDSLSPKLQKEYAGIITHIQEQDFNDMTKSLLFTLEHFPDTDCIHFLGTSGKKEDHTLGNISLLMEYAKALSGRFEAKDYLSQCMRNALDPYRGKYLEMDMVTDYSNIIAITDSCELAVGEGRKVSIISTDNSLRIKSYGLEWPTDDVVFDNLWKATLNRASSDIIKLEFNHPSAALVIM